MKNLRTSAALRLCHRASFLQPAGSREMVTPGGAAHVGVSGPPSAAPLPSDRSARGCADAPHAAGGSRKQKALTPPPAHAEVQVRVCACARVCARMHTRTRGEGR